MALFEEDLVSYLKSNSNIVSAFSDAGATEVRIVPQLLAQTDGRPDISYQRQSTDREYHMRGQSPIVSATFRFRCQSSNYSVVKNLAEALRLALSGFQGMMESTEVEAVFADDDNDGTPVPSRSGKETVIFECLEDYEFHYKEPVPDLIA